MEMLHIVNSLLDDEEEEDMILLYLCEEPKKTKNMFLKRETEGCFQQLILRHLMDDESKFREYFRLTKDEFIGVYTTVSEDLQTVPSSFVPRPISGCEKLALTLRYNLVSNLGYL